MVNSSTSLLLARVHHPEGTLPGRAMTTTSRYVDCNENILCYHARGYMRLGVLHGPAVPGYCTPAAADVA